MTAPRLDEGDTAPPLSLLDSDGTTHSLDSLLTEGRRLLLFVFPAAGTPGCTAETLDFDAASDALAAAGVDVVGLSPDSPEKLARFRESRDIGLTLLSDPEKSTLARWGAFGEKKNYGRVVQGVIRSTFVLGSDGTVETARYNVRAKGHAAMMCRLLGVDLPEDGPGVDGRA